MHAATLTRLLKGAAATYPTRRAIAALGRYELSHVSVDSLIEGAAARLAADVGMVPGRVVALSFADGSELLIMMLAVIRAGGVAAPLDPAYTSDDVAAFLSQPDSITVITDGNSSLQAAAATLGVAHATAVFKDAGGTFHLAGLLPAEADAGGRAARTSATDVVLLVHVHGTSRPRGVAFTQENLLDYVHSVMSSYRLVETDATLGVIPIFDVIGFCVALSSLASGGSVAFAGGGTFFASSFWDNVRASGATWYSAVPTVHRTILYRHTAEPDKSYPALRFIRSCGAPLPPGLLKKMETAFGAPVADDEIYLDLPDGLNTLLKQCSSPNADLLPFSESEVRRVWGRRNEESDAVIMIDNNCSPPVAPSDTSKETKPKISFDAGTSMLLVAYGTLMGSALGIWFLFPEKTDTEAPPSVSNAIKREIWLFGLLLIIVISMGIFAVLILAVTTNRPCPVRTTRTIAVATQGILVVVAMTVAVSVNGWVLSALVFAVICLSISLIVSYALGDLRKNVNALRKAVLPLCCANKRGN